MARRASARSFGLRGIVVLCMDPDSPSIGKFLVFPVAGKAEGIIIVCFDQLRATGPPVGIVTIKAENACKKMSALLKVKPLLMIRFGMGFWISPDSWFKLIIVGEGLSNFIRFIVFVVPGVFEDTVRDTHPSRMALATDFQASVVL
jgi:hypothetical protein